MKPPSYVEIYGLIAVEGYVARVVFGKDTARSKRFTTYAEALAWVVKLTEAA